jgi:acyl-CoA thioesterase
MFEDFIASARSGNTTEISADWGQGRTAFGGLLAAMTCAHGQQLLTDKRPLRSIAVTFSAPLQTDTPFELESELIANGRSISHVQSRARQDGKICCVLNACYALSRESAVEVAGQSLSVKPSYSAGKELPYIAGIVPAFTQHIDFRFTEGDLPFSASQTNKLSGYMKFRAQPSVMDDLAILALVDAWPPAVLPMLTSPAPASSVTWEMELIQPRPALPVERALFYAVQIKEARDGLAHTEAKIYAPSGELIALSRQLVAIYDKK